MERNGVKLKIIGGLLFLFFFLLQSIAFAEVKEIIAEGTYNMGDGETPTVAESRALLQAKRTAVEQAGTYVESYSKVKNFQLIADEIQVLASAVMEVFVLEQKRSIVGNSFNFWVKIKARVSTDKMEEMAKRVKEKSVLEDYKKIQEAYDKSQKEIEELKKELAVAKSTQGKNEIKTKIAKDEKLFLANKWFEKGYYHGMNKEYDKAIEEFTRAIELNPKLAVAYGNRSFTYSNLGNYQQAVDDGSKAIELDPGISMAYVNRALGYGKLGKLQEALADINKAIELDPKNALAYGSRSFVYSHLGNYQQTLKDADKAIELDPKNALAYANRGDAYSKLGIYEGAIGDYKTAAGMGHTGAQTLLLSKGISW